MLPYYPARDGHPAMFETDDDAASAVGATELAPAVGMPTSAFAFVCATLRFRCNPNPPFGNPCVAPGVSHGGAWVTHSADPRRNAESPKIRSTP